MVRKICKIYVGISIASKLLANCVPDSWVALLLPG
jgi:hypothetical protein